MITQLEKSVLYVLSGIGVFLSISAFNGITSGQDKINDRLISMNEKMESVFAYSSRQNFEITGINTVLREELIKPLSVESGYLLAELPDGMQSKYAKLKIYKERKKDG